MSTTEAIRHIRSIEAGVVSGNLPAALQDALDWANAMETQMAGVVHSMAVAPVPGLDNKAEKLVTDFNKLTNSAHMGRDTDISMRAKRDGTTIEFSWTVTTRRASLQDVWDRYNGRIDNSDDELINRMNRFCRNAGLRPEIQSFLPWKSLIKAMRVSNPDGLTEHKEGDFSIEQLLIFSVS